MAHPNTEKGSKLSDASHLLRPSEKYISRPSNPAKMLQKYTGFTSISNVLLFGLTAGIFGVYCITRLPSLDVENGWSKKVGPGEWYWFREGLSRIGMTMHLWSTIQTYLSKAAGVLMPIQFLPIIRRRFVNLHRWNGRQSLILLMVANISKLIIRFPRLQSNWEQRCNPNFRTCFRGHTGNPVCSVMLASITTVSATKGYLAIRNLRLDQHRFWMLRLWAYASAILTMRLVLVLVVLAASLSPGSYQSVSTCQEIIFAYEHYSIPLEKVYSAYPSCRNFTSSIPAYVVVIVAIVRGHPEQLIALLNLSFGPSAWISGFIHVFGIEIYLRMTTGEDEALKTASLARRRAAGIIDTMSRSGKT